MMVCLRYDSEVLMNITGDKNVLNMFSRNENRIESEVFVELCGVDEGECSENETEVEEEGEDSENEINVSKKEEEVPNKSPFLGFDGCHLKGPIGGVLLAAIGLDGNNGLFPIAFAIAESECKESWGFFFENLSNMLGGFSYDKPWTFMRDRQKGLGCSGIPCKHAALGISHRRESLESFCDGRFSKENYMKTYSYCVHVVPDPIFWPQDLEVEPTNLLPPIVRRMPGRPKKNRRKEPSKPPNVIRRSNMVRCKVCNDLGHNKRTCPVIQQKEKDLKLDVPLAQLVSRKRKTKGSSSQFVSPTKINKKTKVKSLSQLVPKPPISLSQPLPNTEHGLFNACCRISITTTIKLWSNISTTKLLERARSFPTKEDKKPKQSGC
ncbi:hypothetical protein Sango_2488000 [Sesamum angolense]|uniref:MULE transposase domain-containing protein n=1 Tax=Sesamum angolense TaxID=2727404 RepID=A0AAE1W3Q1_9LAMI|nr:hypothetical protein Sango_2488000 [Sesamum angolense]